MYKNGSSLDGKTISLLYKLWQHIVGNRNGGTYKSLLGEEDVRNIVDPEAVGFEEPIRAYFKWSLP